MLIALDNGFQGALMAPTEILAQQHFATLSRMLKGMPVVVRLLTGSTKTAERKSLLTALHVWAKSTSSSAHMRCWRTVWCSRTWAWW
jgi:RecG-like helicase